MSLRRQIPLMYLLMTINAAFLATVASRHTSLLISIGVPVALTLVTSFRAIVWLTRRGHEVPISQIRRHIRGTNLAAAILSLLFGSWGLLLFAAADPLQASSIALYVFVGAIGSCYCLQALPSAARLVLLFGAAPITARLLASGDWYLVGIGLTFLLVAGVILKTLATSRSAFGALLQSRSDMSALVTALQQTQEHYRYSVDLNPQIPWISEPDGSVSELSPRWTLLTGMSVEDGLGTGWTAAVHPDDLPQWLECWNTALRYPDRQKADARYRLRQADGSYRWVRVRSYPRRNSDGLILKWYGNVEDIDDQVTAEIALHQAAYHDPLTGLSNRSKFGDELERALADAKADGLRLGVAVVDIDNFKSINDSLGHAAGDAVLKAIGHRITAVLPVGAVAARLGGDEFALVLPDIGNGEFYLVVVRQILDAISQPLTIDESAIDIRGSAGAAVWPDDGIDAEAVLQSADLALYAVKANGAANVEAFRPELRRAVDVRKGMLRDARDALRDDRIIPFYQPKICLASGKIVGFEALLRWQHPQRGLQPPSSVAAAFDDGALSTQLTDRMLDRVLDDIARWRDNGCQIGKIAINGSSADFRRGDFAERILERLDRFAIPASLLELEVTETVFLGQATDAVERTLHTLRAEGVTIALDDFGTGYASLAHLQQFPVDVLKIDRSFVSRLDSPESADFAIVHGVIDIARRLKVQTVAEGVENAAQLHRLRELKCDVAQGYLFGRALSAGRLGPFIEAWPNVRRRYYMNFPFNDGAVRAAP